ncbi:MAG: ATP-binding cassette domain-containing protein, partial [Nitriliruptoraceae bacterium]
MDEVLRCTGLRKAFGSLQAVDDVSLTVERGETYGLLGPNGAGKTTSISMIAGLLRPDAGEVFVVGRPLTPTATAAKAAIGLVPQEVAIYPDLSARENLRFFGHLYGLERGELTSRIDETLEIIGLSDRAGDRAATFSGGMTRRLNIGIGLLHRPELLILDEPTVGVDPQSRNAILASVEALATDGMAVLYTTHYMEEAERLCDRIGIIDQGRLVAEGSRRSLVAMVGGDDLVHLTVDGDAQAAAASLRQLPDLGSVDVENDAIVCLLEGAAGRLPALLDAVGRAGAAVTGVEVREPDLEDVFLH